MNCCCKISWIWITTIISLILFVADSDAQIIELTDPSLPGGSKNITLDQSTGLEWLDWSATTNLSYDQVLSQTCPGGVYEGFRLATREEVRVLFCKLGLNVSNWPNSTWVVADGVSGANAIAVIGKTDDVPAGAIRSVALAERISWNSFAGVQIIAGQYPNSGRGFTSNLGSASSQGISPNPGIGFALIRGRSPTLQVCPPSVRASTCTACCCARGGPVRRFLRRCRRR